MGKLVYTDVRLDLALLAHRSFDDGSVLLRYAVHR